ncbi:GH25 family lysozyme [Plastorhodobacter daqingensis]|uniref:GH25 family lysozyme n=1 Tax=Plastorhodobacter daqingensis TaxID=1387281 RepID=A0ABW2UI27_9RHOB
MRLGNGQGAVAGRGRLELAVLLIALALVLAACGRNIPRPGAPVTFTAPLFGDAQPVDWPGRRPTQYPIHGIDVSRWQSDVNWRAVQAAGVSFAFIKATEGGDHMDPMFSQHWREAGAAGIPRGAYHFYYFCRTAEENARWFIANVPRERGALPPVLDMEWTRSRNCPHRPGGAHIRAEAAQFLDIVGRHYGQRPIIYTTVDFYRDTGIGSLAGVEFWLRSVADHPGTVYPGQRWVFWQYTGTGLVPGVRGPVDINVFHGQPGAWAQWLTARRQ